MNETQTENRTLSCFFARELFSLYLEDKLDPARRAQVDEHLRRCAACPALFDREKAVQRMIQSLSSTEPVPEVVEYVKREQAFWQEAFEKAAWSKWPPSLKWAVELGTVAMILIVTIHYFPWMNLARRLRGQPAGVAANLKPGQPPGQPANTIASESTTGGATTGTGETSGAAAGANVQSAQGKPDMTHAMEDVSGKSDEEASALPPSPVMAKAKSQPQAKENVPPVGSPLKTTQAAAPAAKVAANTDSVEENDESDEAEESQESKQDANIKEAAENDETGAVAAGQKTGYLWRGTMKVSEVSDETAEKVSKAITDLGGTKAGQVELGWHRGNQRYYHFILPEENYEKLLNALNEEGIVQLTKERHPRMLKPGYMRIIMTIEEGE